MSRLFKGMFDEIGKKKGFILDARASLQGNEGTGGSIRLEGILEECTGERVKMTDAKIWLYDSHPIESSEVYIPEDRIVLMYTPEGE